MINRVWRKNIPTYTFKRISTGEQFDDIMSYAARQSLLESDDNIEAVVTSAAFVSGISGRTHKNDSGFNDMMSRIATANPSSPLAEKYGDKGVKATKSREAVQAQKKRQLTSQ